MESAAGIKNGRISPANRICFVAAQGGRGREGPCRVRRAVAVRGESVRGVSAPALLDGVICVNEVVVLLCCALFSLFTARPSLFVSSTPRSYPFAQCDRPSGDSQSLPCDHCPSICIPAQITRQKRATPPPRNTMARLGVEEAVPEHPDHGRDHDDHRSVELRGRRRACQRKRRGARCVAAAGRSAGRSHRSDRCAPCSSSTTSCA